jgi:hypothetical protein
MDPLEWNNLAKRPEYARQKEEMARWLPKVNKEPPDAQKKKAERKAKKNK